jgi:hypothetical protein
MHDGKETRMKGKGKEGTERKGMKEGRKVMNWCWKGKERKEGERKGKIIMAWEKIRREVWKMERDAERRNRTRKQRGSKQRQKERGGGCGEGKEEKWW